MRAVVVFCCICESAGEGYDMSSDLDQALLLYFDGQQAKTSIQEQQPRKPLDFCRKKVQHSEKCLATFHYKHIYAEGICHCQIKFYYF
jgi:hypothetical protein